MYLTPVIVVFASCLMAWLGARIVGRGFQALSLDDPALAERFDTYRKSLGTVVVFATLIGISLFFIFYSAPFEKQLSHLLATPLIVFWLLAVSLSVGLADRPIRRKFLGDQSKIIEYIDFSIRFSLAFFGFWLAIALLPPVILYLNSGYWIGGVLCALALIGWSANYPKAISRILKSKPIEDPDLKSRLGLIDGKSNARKPIVEICGPENGVWTNALALPSLKRPRVLLSAPLIRKLDPDEVAAIYAHELAHIEDFDDTWLKRAGWMDRVLILCGCLGLPYLMHLGGEDANWLAFIWMLVVLFFLVLRVKDFQKREVFADRRAVELIGNPEPLISGLQKIYQNFRMPRRVDAGVDRLASHPSLARRIQEIRRKAAILDGSSEIGVQEDREGNLSNGVRDAQVFHLESDQPEILILDHKRIARLSFDDEDWLTDHLDSAPFQDREKWIQEFRNKASAESTSTYSGLHELRLVLKGKKALLRTVEPPRLVRDSRIRAEDIGRLQGFLDTVDHQLTPIKKLSAHQHPIARLSVFVAGICIFLASMQGGATLGAAVLVLMGVLPAMITCKRAWMAAVGGGVLFYALRELLFSAGHVWWGMPNWLALSLAAFAGFVALWQTWVKSEDNPSKFRLDTGSPKAVFLMVFLIGGLFTFPTFFSLLHEDTRLMLYYLARNVHAPFIPFLFGGCALFVCRSISKRVLGVAFMLIGTSPAYFGSDYFLINHIKDPLATSAPSPRFATNETPVSQSLSLSHEYWDFNVSPTGRNFIANTSYHDSDSDAYSSNGQQAYALFDWSGESRHLIAVRLAWTSDGELLALINEDGKGFLRLFAWDQIDIPLWEIEVEGLIDFSNPILESNQGSWRITTNGSSSATVVFEGELGSEKIEIRNWYNEGFSNRSRFVTDADNLFETTWNPISQGESGSVRRIHWALSRHFNPTGLRFIESDGKAIEHAWTGLWTYTVKDIHLDKLYVVSNNSRSAWLWEVDSQNASLLPRWKLPQSYFIGVYYNSVWQVTKSQIRHFDLNTGVGYSFPASGKSDWYLSVSVSKEHCLIAWPESDGQKLELISLDTLSKTIQ